MNDYSSAANKGESLTAEKMLDAYRKVKEMPVPPGGYATPEQWVEYWRWSQKIVAIPMPLRPVFEIDQMADAMADAAALRLSALATSILLDGRHEESKYAWMPRDLGEYLEGLADNG